MVRLATSEVGRELLFAVAFVLLGSLAAALAILRYPPVPASVPPPLEITRPKITALGPELVLSFNLTACSAVPRSVRVEAFALNGTGPLLEAMTGGRCGPYNLTFPARPYLLLSPALYLINVSLGGGSYVYGYFEEAANLTYSFRFAGISYANGTVYVTVNYTVPFRANLTVSRLIVIDDDDQAIVAAGCNGSANVTVYPAVNGSVAVPLSCSYVNAAEFGKRVVYDFRGAVVATFFTPGGSFTQEVGVIDRVLG